MGAPVVLEGSTCGHHRLQLLQFFDLTRGNFFDRVLESSDVGLVEAGDECHQSGKVIQFVEKL